MWMVVGLGNFGEAYESTRHNIGFMVIDALSDRFSIPLEYKTKNFTYGRGFIGEKEVVLIKPLTFMNKSGIAVRDALRKYLDIDSLLVVHDDIDLAKGAIRIKKSGSSGGHRGIQSIIEIIGTKDFLRLKIGIGRSDRIPPEDYVLTPFPRREQAVVKRTVEDAVNAINAVINKGVASAQSEFHRK